MMERVANVQTWISESRKICEALIFAGRPGAAQLLLTTLTLVVNQTIADVELVEISRKVSLESLQFMDTATN